MNDEQIFAVKETLKLYRANKQVIVAERDRLNDKIDRLQANKLVINNDIDELNASILVLTEGITE